MPPTPTDNMGRRHGLLLGCLFLISGALLLRNEVNLHGKILLTSLQAWNEPVDANFGLQQVPSSSSLPRQTNADWFHETVWNANNSTNECWQVENLCHSSHRWFYDTRSPRIGRQPPFVLDMYGSRLKLNITNTSATFMGRPRILRVQSPSSSFENIDPREDTELITPSFLQTCTYSPIPNHLVLQSHFNEMLGEFYGRSLNQLNYLQKSVLQSLSQSAASLTNDWNQSTTPFASTPTEARARFLEQTQIYLHVRTFTEHSKLLDSHHLFTDAFRSNPLLSFTSLLDYTGCRCMKRLFLCGYNAKNGKQVGNVRGVFSNSSVPTELEPASKTLTLKTHDLFPLRELRQRLRDAVINNNPFLQHDIVNFRSNAISRHRPMLAHQLTRNEVNEFRIVGLTQRTGRRRWLNLDDTLRRCNTEWFGDDDKIVCVEINLENVDVNPVRQVVIHAACDMIFGIHGAQLTEAIWMRDGSVVVELLPWMPDNAKYGPWTRSTHRPTPLGVIFSESPLNHIGYRLERASAPYCLNKTDPLELKQCFRGFLWDNRDFQVNPETIKDMIGKFAPTFHRQGAEVTVPICGKLQERAGHRIYVLYNVYCSNGTVANDAPSVHHFYWPKEKDANGRRRRDE